MNTRWKNPAERTGWLKRDAYRSLHCFVEEMGLGNENWERRGWVKRETGLCALHWPMVEAVEEM